jgi:hypothetical protein
VVSFSIGYAKMRIRELLEAVQPKVGRKYQHIEDLVLSHGYLGGKHAVERLRDLQDQGGTIELKWDGMPVVYWGRDADGTFMMIPKNAWAYIKSGKTQTASGAPTVMRSPKDVKSFILSTGSGDRTQFAEQFASLWPYLEKVSPKKGFLEGGLLFYPGNKPDGKSAMPVINRKTKTYDFKPNITTFHVPMDSELGKKIANATVMVAATGYYPTLGGDEQRLDNASSLSTPDVIVQGTTYVQDPVDVDDEALNNIDSYLDSNKDVIENYLSAKKGLNNPAGELYTYLNQHLRTDGLVRDFPTWAKQNLSEKKQETMLADKKGYEAVLGAIEALGKEKQKIIDVLSQGLHGGLKQTRPEGYAQAHPQKRFKHDIPDQFVKFIDQLNWRPSK